MGAIVLIAVCLGYFVLVAGLAGLWLLRPAARRRARPAAGSLIGRVGPAAKPSRATPRRPRKGSTEPPLVLCSFCGKTQDQVAKLISGPSVYICDECVALCQDIVKERRPESWDDRPGPAALAGLLNRVVDGHRHAKMALATAIWRHVGRFKRPLVGGDDLRCHVLLAGGSSIVRRRLIRFLADLSDLPMITIDADELVASGDRMEALKALCLAVYEPFMDDIVLPPAILYVENLDRLRGSTASGAIQRALLTILQGGHHTEWELWGAPIGDSRKVQLICGGDFDGVAENGRDFVTADLERFGVCRPLADCLATIAILGTSD